MFHYIVEFQENETWGCNECWTRPFYDNHTLDESLDFGQITLFGATRKEPFKPFSPLRITIYETEENEQQYEQERYKADTVYRLMSDTLVVQKAFAYNDGEDRYNHTIGTIELTKELERYVCDTLMFTNYLGKYYASYSQPVEIKTTYHRAEGAPNYNLEPKESVVNAIIKSNQPKGEGDTFIFPAFNDMWARIPGYICEWMRFVKGPDGEFIVNDFGSNSYPYPMRTDTDTEDLTVILKEGNYTASYEVNYAPSSTSDLPRPPQGTRVDFNFTVVKNREPKPKKSIAYVLNRILDVSETRREGDAPRFRLDDAIAEKYSEIEAPEFHITRSTLWEALSQVGGYIHAIPRLVYPNVITFDELGGANEYIPPNGLRCVAYSAQRSIDETCDAIDSTVENYLCTEDLSQGTVTEPCADGWKSVRCEEGQFLLSNDNALILTDHAIYRIVKVEVAKKVGGLYWEKIGDITPYIFESAEYDTLTSYGGAYPLSRSYALKYSQGDNKITEFTFKPETRSFIGELAKYPAIENIIASINGNCPTLYNELGFRVTCIPSTSARVKQYKPFAEDGKLGNNTLLYNQSANTVESASYGENLKGTIARLGNTDEQRTYLFEHYADIPKVGRLWDGKYIARVECEYQKEWIKATVTLTENFNRLAQYLGLHTNYRLYDVSEKQSEERQINYSERVIIGDEITEDSGCGITEAGVSSFEKTLTGHSGEVAVDNAIVIPMEENKREIVSTNMSCYSTALGNSVAFSWKFLDNYGAGYKSSYASSFSSYIDEKTFNKFKRIQELVPCGNVFGEFYYLSLRLFNGAPSSFSASEPDNLPEYNVSVVKQPLFDFSTFPFVIRKDSREQINMTYQLHFISNRRSIIIGSGLGQLNALVSPEPMETELYFSDKRLNVFRPMFPKDATGRKDFKITRTQKQIILTIPATPKGTKSWALVGVRRDKDGNIKSKQLIIGENIDGKVLPVYFNFVSNKQ